MPPYPGYEWAKLFELLRDFPNVKIQIMMNNSIYPVIVEHGEERFYGSGTEDATARQIQTWLAWMQYGKPSGKP